MKIERKGEPYGDFTVEISERFEAQMRKAANEMVMSAKKAPGDTEIEIEKLIVDYQEYIESSVSLLLSIIGLAFLRPKMLPYVFSALHGCLESLSDHFKREAQIKEGQNRQNN